ncbi:MAG: hypothetical protein AB1744_07655, partial [Candidatus Zixiibacteriota bacterium]
DATKLATEDTGFTTAPLVVHLCFRFAMGTIKGFPLLMQNSIILARKQMAVKSKRKPGSGQDRFRWPYGRKNYLLFALAVIVIVIGYITLGQGSITWAPILLVLGYCVLIPIALIIRAKPKEDTGQTQGDLPTDG